MTVRLKLFCFQADDGMWFFKKKILRFINFIKNRWKIYGYKQYRSIILFFFEMKSQNIQIWLKCDMDIEKNSFLKKRSNFCNDSTSDGAHCSRRIKIGHIREQRGEIALRNKTIRLQTIFSWNVKEGIFSVFVVCIYFFRCFRCKRKWKNEDQQLRDVNNKRKRADGSWTFLLIV